MTKALTRFTLRGLGWCLLVAALLGGALLVIDAVEPGSTPRFHELLALLGAAVLSGATALCVVDEREAGRWSGWQALGVDPRRLAAGLLLVALLGAAGSLAPQGPGAMIALPAPVDPAATVWPAPEGGWRAPPPARWSVSPGALPLSALLARSADSAPRGARRHVDRGELLRRLGLALGWLLAVPVGLAVGQRAADRERGALASPTRAAGLLLLWTWVALVVAAVSAGP